MPEIILYGVIGEATDGLDAASVCQAIRSASGNLTVRINSPGGLVFDGLPIYEALRSYNRGTVTVIIDGLAASMASVIAMAGTEIIMAESAMMMVHKPWDCSIGNADDLRADADQLDRVERQLNGIYARRTGLSPDVIGSMLADETWLDASEAIAAGFADRINSTLAIAARLDLSPFGFRRTPENLTRTRSMPEAITPSASSSPLGQPAGADPVLIERQRIANIHSLCASHGLGSAFAAQLVDRGLPVAAARDAILDALADRDQASGNHFGSPSATFDNPGFFGQAMEDALYAKLSGKAATGPAAEFRGMSMVDMAAEMITRAGRGNPRRMTPDQILNAAAWLGGGPRAWGGGSGNYATSRSAIVTTAGDFPDLLQASGQRFLLDQYKAAESPLKRIGRPRQARDFRPINTLQLSQFGTLPVVAEGGEIVTGTFASRKETYQLQTFAKQFSLTRQAIINDDLGAFSDPLTIMGRAAAETEAQLLAALINSNPAMADGQALFSSTHANLNDTGAAPAVPALDAARQAMRLQKDADGTTYINAAPHYIVSGVAYETAIERLISIPTNPTQVDQANPFFGKLVPLVDPRLGGNYWYLFSDPSFVPTIEYANLNGAEGPTAEMQNGWDVLGCSFRVYEDFGAGIVDYRGAYRQAGA